MVPIAIQTPKHPKWGPFWVFRGLGGYFKKFIPIVLVKTSHYGMVAFNLPLIRGGYYVTTTWNVLYCVWCRLVHRTSVWVLYHRRKYTLAPAFLVGNGIGFFITAHPWADGLLIGLLLAFLDWWFFGKKKKKTAT